MSETLELAKQLIRKPSVTPEDCGCQQLIAERLEKVGFTIENLRFGVVDNLWARRGNAKPLFVFAGHTDVVPTGPLEDWSSDPFAPEVRGDYLYGRGAADMKGSIAAMVVAVENFLSHHPQHAGSIAFLITGDEEGPSIDGTVKVVEHLTARDERIDWCLVGEPTSKDRLGDVIKNGRRGSINGKLRIKGLQGHVAYPQLADNPIHKALPALAELAAVEWDAGNEYFPPTTFQIANLSSGTGAENVIPGVLDAQFNLRFSTETSEDAIRAKVEAIIKRHGLDYEIQWRLSGQPFLTAEAELVEAARGAIRAVTGVDTELSTSGGTSDGRFIAPTGAQVVELGPVNATIHQINECVKAQELDTLASVYEDVLTRLLT